MPIFHDGNGPIKNTKTVDARVCVPVCRETSSQEPNGGVSPCPRQPPGRPVVRFSAVGQVNVHPLLVGGLASIWCRVRGTLGYSCLPGCLPMAFSLDTGMVTTMVTRKTAFFRVAYLALTDPQTKPHKPCCVSESTSGSGHQTLLQHSLRMPVTAAGNEKARHSGRASIWWWAGGQLLMLRMVASNSLKVIHCTNWSAAAMRSCTVGAVS